MLYEVITKTTMLNVLNGSYVPTYGSVKVNGIDINAERNQIV